MWREETAFYYSQGGVIKVGIQRSDEVDSVFHF